MGIPPVAWSAPHRTTPTISPRETSKDQQKPAVDGLPSRERRQHRLNIRHYQFFKDFVDLGRRGCVVQQILQADNDERGV